MCRHLAYLGPSTNLASLLLAPPHSLLVQSYAPKEMRGAGTINVDGHGAGWWPDDAAGAAAPQRYRSAVPIWTDSAFHGLAASIRTTATVGAVRSASPGFPVVETACAPFTDGHWLFSLNGRVLGWPDSIAALAAELPVTALLTMDAPTDSALLFALVIDRIRRGASPADAVADVVTRVATAAPGSRLNLLLSDGSSVVASAYTHALSVRRDPGAVTVASEPTDDDPAWQPVPDRHLLVATTEGCDQYPLPIRTEEP